MSREELAQILIYYRDLGIDEIYAAMPESKPDSTPSTKPSVPAAVPAPVAAKPDPLPEVELPPLLPTDDTLEKIRADIGDCKRCRLCEGRRNIVFGSGNPES